MQQYGGVGIGFTAPDSPVEVGAYYKDQMAAKGWSLMVDTSTGDQINQIWQKANRVTSLSISIVEGETNVTLLMTDQ